jgi:hypothetical protein
VNTAEISDDTKPVPCVHINIESTAAGMQKNFNTHRRYVGCAGVVYKALTIRRIRPHDFGPQHKSADRIATHTCRTKQHITQLDKHVDSEMDE